MCKCASFWGCMLCSNVYHCGQWSLSSVTEFIVRGVDTFFKTHAKLASSLGLTWSDFCMLDHDFSWLVIVASLRPKIYQETRFMCFLASMWCANVKKSILWEYVFLNRCQLISNWNFSNQLFPLICNAPYPFIFLLKWTYRPEIGYIGVNEDAVYNKTIRHCISW
jgi:hypothetical protein